MTSHAADCADCAEFVLLSSFYIILFHIIPDVNYN